MLQKLRKSYKPDQSEQTQEIDSNLVDSYSVLAEIYDELMCHVDYQLWVHYALEILGDHGLEFGYDNAASPFLECGCGTGTFALNLAFLGFDVSAFDASDSMIEIAKSKSVGLERPPKFSTMRFLELNEVERFKVAFCLYDSVNYLLNIDDLQLFFDKVKNALIPGGMFLFDICTIFNSQRYFSNRSQIESGPDFWSERQMHYNSKTRVQENKFSIKVDTHPGKTFTEVHQQKLYTVREIKKLISRTGLDLLEVTDGYTRKPPNRQSLRIHFLCRKR